MEGLQRAFEDLRADMNRPLQQTLPHLRILLDHCSRSVDRLVLQVGCSQLLGPSERWPKQLHRLAVYRAGGACGFDSTQLPVR